MSTGVFIFLMCAGFMLFVIFMFGCIYVVLAIMDKYSNVINRNSDITISYHNDGRKSVVAKIRDGKLEGFSDEDDLNQNEMESNEFYENFEDSAEENEEDDDDPIINS